MRCRSDWYPSYPIAVASRVTDGWLTPASSATSLADRYGARVACSTSDCAMRRWVGVSRCPEKRPSSLDDGLSATA
jgi:hypothetical protein